MKSCLLPILLLLSIAVSVCRAQNPTLYGMTFEGGTGSSGNIFQTNATGSIFKSDHSFYSSSSGYPEGDVIQASDDLLYGMTSAGGAYGFGVMFSYNIITGTYTDLHDFGNSSDGENPSGSLTQASNGLLYGMTPGGGATLSGMIFSYDITTSTYTDIYDFGFAPDGQNPNGTLIQASNNLLYGTTSQGGLNYSGIIFSYNIATGMETDIHDFGSFGDGDYPDGSLLQANNGLLYGMTYNGGVDYGGMIFSYNITTGIEADIHDFGSGADGQYPYGSLIQASNNLLYGMTYEGGANYAGTLLSFDIATGIETDIYDFGNGFDGQSPYGSLIQASNGLLYGMTEYGGNTFYGMLFSYNISTGTETDTHDFGFNNDGNSPMGSLIQASNGLLYGMTYSGGTAGQGIILSYNTSTVTETDIYNFGGAPVGENPYGSLMLANDGLLYGMTEDGGLNEEGILFSYNINADSITDLHDFGSGFDGSDPMGAMLQAKNGLLYGMTQDGGAYSEGIIFSYNINTGTYTDLYDFGNGFFDGQNPYGTLIQATNGLLYGLTENGGPGDSGTLFSYNILTGIETNLYGFNNGLTGFSPDGSIIQANNGLLYGTTDDNGGAYGQGTIFSYNITTGSFIDLHDFGNGNDGQQPVGTPFQATNGLLYGMAPEGGVYYAGMMYSYNITNGSYNDLHDFGNGTDGSLPVGDVIQASNGLLYGLTSEGGANGSGIIFSYDISTNNYTDIHDFTGIDGDSPFGDLLEVDSILYVTPFIPNVCTGDSITLTATGASSYTWSPATGLNATTGSSVIASPTVTTTYTITGTKNSGVNSVTVTVTVYPYPTITANSPLPICGGSSAILSASGGVTYSWSPSTGLNSTIGSSVVASPTATTTYFVTGTNAGGCSSAGSDTVTIIPAPPLTIIPPSAFFCSGLNTTLTVSGGGSNFVWSPSTGLNTTTGSSVIASPTLSATYTVAGIDSIGCNASGSVEITIIPSPNKPSFRQHKDTLISSSKYDNQWYRNDTLLINDTSQSLIVTALGNYWVMVLNEANGCSSTSDTTKIDSITGINQLALTNNQLSIYPNPTSGEFTIKINSNQNGYVVEVYNVLGEKIYQAFLYNSQSTINLSSQAAGLYFVYLKSEENVEVGKVLLTK